MSLANIKGKLSRDEMKKIMAGSGTDTSKCNAYCGSGSNVTCGGFCSTCEDAGNASNPGIPGGNKICA